MGVCEGPPRSIYPDPNGRADYLGDSINQAARFMDAGVDKVWGLIKVWNCAQLCMGYSWLGPPLLMLCGPTPLPPKALQCSVSTADISDATATHFPCPGSKPPPPPPACSATAFRSAAAMPFPPSLLSMSLEHHL